MLTGVRLGEIPLEIAVMIICASAGGVISDSMVEKIGVTVAVVGGSVGVMLGGSPVAVGGAGSVGVPLATNTGKVGSGLPMPGRSMVSPSRMASRSGGST